MEKQSDFAIYPVIKVKTLNQFIAKVQKFDSGLTLYRGQSQKFRLIPRIGRRQFHQIFTGSFAENEKKMFEEFRRLSVPYLENQNLSEWDLLSIGQHYGLPTRLLDWTTNPLTALFFALENVQPSQRKPPVVWCLKPEGDDFVTQKDYDLSPFEIQRTKVFTPRVVADRLKSQNGWFSIHRYSDKSKAGRFIPLEGQTQFQPGKLMLIEFELNNRNRIDSVRNRLSLLGINSSTIYPDLGGLSKYLDWLYFPTEFELNSR